MLLLDKLNASAPSRIINVSSLAHAFGEMNFEDLNSQQSYGARAAYGQSKLANVLFTRELAKKLHNTSVTVNAVHPGCVFTERHMLVPTLGLCRALLSPLFWLLFKTPVQGAQTSLYCALAAELEGVSGRYFSDYKEKEAAKQAKDDEGAKRLWVISEQWTGLS